jgi:site-specific DNA recombinase
MNLKLDYENFDEKIESCKEMLGNIDKFYVSSTTEVKRKIISSIFPEKLIFENNQCRTHKMNEAVKLIYFGNMAFEDNKKGKTSFFLKSSLEVVSPGIEPGTQGFSVLCSTN